MPPPITIASWVESLIAPSLPTTPAGPPRPHDAGRRQTTEVLGNGITETRSYRSDNLLSGISYSNTSLGDLSYTWDANKNKTSESITGVMSGTVMRQKRAREGTPSIRAAS